jgi:hypothetical protein
MRPFGCEAYAFILPESDQAKLGRRAWHVKPLGYEPGSKAYKLLDLDSGSIRTSHHVRFLEPEEQHLTKMGPTREDQGTWWDDDDEDIAPADLPRDGVGGLPLPAAPGSDLGNSNANPIFMVHC